MRVKSIRDSILWIIISTISHTNKEPDLLIARLEIVLEIFTVNLICASSGYLLFEMLYFP